MTALTVGSFALSLALGVGSGTTEQGDVVTLGTLDGAGLDGPVVFSGDGKRVAAASREGAAVIDVDTGKTLRAVRGTCAHLALSTKGDKLACDGRLIDVATGNEDADADVVARSTDGRVAVRVNPMGAPVLEVGSVRAVLHPAPGTPKAKNVPGAPSPTVDRYRVARSVSLSRDAKFVLLEGDDGTSVFRATDGALVGTVAKDIGPGSPRAQGGAVLVVYAPSGLIVYELATGAEKRRIALPSSAGGFHGQLALSADGRTLAAVDYSDTYVVDVPSGEVTRAVHPRNLGSISRAALAPDGKTLVVTSSSAPLKRVSMQSGATLGVPGRHGSMVEAAAFSADGSRVVTGAVDGVRVWSADGSLVHYEPGLVGSVSMPDAHTVLVVSGSVARLAEDEKGAWSVTGSSSELTRGAGKAVKDGKSAWVMTDATSGLTRIDAVTGAALASADRIGGSSYDVRFDVDDKGRLAVATGNTVLFGSPGAMREREIERPPVDKTAKRNRIDLLDERVVNVLVSGDGAWVLVQSGSAGLIALPTTATTATTATKGPSLNLEGTSGAFVPRTNEAVVVASGELRVVRLTDGAVLARSKTAADARVLAVSEDGKRAVLSTGIQALLAPVPH